MGYIFNPELQTPDDIKRQRDFADMLLQNQQPARDMFGVLGIGLSGLGAILANRKADRAERGWRDNARSLWQNYLTHRAGSNGSPDSGAAPDVSPGRGVGAYKLVDTPASANPTLNGVQRSMTQAPQITDIGRAQNAIAGIESGGNYRAVGPVTAKGDRAYGKYQIMGANIPEWTQAALGVSMTPEQFLADDEAQDKVFNHRFGGYMQQHGPENAASMWFTGRPLAQGANASDQLGTTGQQYADRFMQGFQRNSGDAIGSRFAALKKIGIGRSSVQPASYSPQIDDFMQAMNDPAFEYLSPQQQQLMIADYQASQKANDPMAQMDMQAKRLELAKRQLEYDAMQNPGPKYEHVGDTIVQTNAPGGPRVVYKDSNSDVLPEVTDVGGKRVIMDKRTGTIIKELGDSPLKQQTAPTGHRFKEDGKTLERIPGFRDTSYEMDMRKEFDDQTKDFRVIRDAYNRIQASTRNPSPAGDLSLIFSVQKMNDPGSVVRESEFATAAAAGSYGERVKAAVQRVMTGQRLTPEMRADFVENAAKLYNEQELTFSTLAQHYRDLAIRSGLDPDSVVITPKANSQNRGSAKGGQPDFSTMSDDELRRMAQ